jgi:glutamine synthetase
LDACLYAGLKISGINAEVAPGQWEFQIGPAVGIDAGDHLWMARYLLERITEDFGGVVYIDYHPKPLQGINGSGCHCNYSTNEMREGREGKQGIEFIYEAIKKLEDNHDEHMKVYGAENDKRMTGLHETSSYKKFTHGKANRGCSVRIGNKTVEERRGYFEDRRPASNCDPYLVTSKIFETTTA